MTHACSHVFSLSFFFLPMLSTSFFLAPQRSNKVVSIATQKQVTDSRWCQSSCCQAHRTSSHFIILNIEPFLCQVEVRVEIHGNSLGSIDMFWFGRRSLVAGIPHIKPGRRQSLFQQQRENPQAIPSLTFPKEMLNQPVPNNYCYVNTVFSRGPDRIT